MNDKELNTAALRNLPQCVKTGPTATSFELGYGSLSKLDAQLNAIKECRQRVSGITDKRIRKAYERWLDFFQRENDEARLESETGVRRKAWLEYKVREQAEQLKIRQHQEEIVKP
jgi:hypothetical protein